MINVYPQKRPTAKELIKFAKDNFLRTQSESVVSIEQEIQERKHNITVLQERLSDAENKKKILINIKL